MDENNKFLSDREIKLNNDNDLLGTGIYVRQLEKLIEECLSTEYTETIGLVGNWGSGKSSIVKTVIENMKKKKLNSKPIVFKVYNAWKYNKDSFRKQFLINIVEDKKKEKELEEKLYTNETYKKITIKKQFIWLSSIIIFIVAVAVCCIYLKDTTISPIEVLKEIFDSIQKIFAIAAVSFVATTLFKNIAVEETISKVKVFSPQQFSDEFEEIISNKNKYYVFVIDDLDRCDPAQTIEILDTIKSYLKVDKGNYLFLIPIDKNRLYKILENQKQYDYRECENYYSKIFDLSVVVKEPGNANLFNMISIEKDNIQLNLSNKSISILADYLIETPRDVKTHLNNLKVMLNILDNQIKLQYVIVEDLENLKDQIVKLYIIEKKWNDIFIWIKSKYKNIDINEMGHMPKEYIENEEFKRFLKQSLHTKIDKVGAYINLRVDEYDIDNNLVVNIISGNIKDVSQDDFDIKFITHFDFAYKRYIVDQQLYIEYLPNLLKLYFYALCNCSDVTVFEESQINLANINDGLVALAMYADRKIDIYLEEIKEFSKIPRCNVNFVSLYECFIDFLLDERYYDDAACIISNINCLLSSKKIMSYILHIINNDSNCIDLGNILSIESLSNSNKEDILKSAIAKNRKDVVKYLLHENKEYLNEYGEDVLNILTIYNKLSNSPSAWEMDKITNDYIELKIINLFLEFSNDSLFQKLKTKCGFVNVSTVVQTVRNKLFNSEYYSSLVGELGRMYLLVDKRMNTRDKLSIFINCVDNEANSRELISILNLLESSEKKNELYILMLCKTQFKLFVDEYCDYLNDAKNLIYLKVWKELLAKKSSQNYNFTTLSNPNYITLNYSQYMNGLYPQLLSLNSEMSVDIIKASSFEQLCHNQSSWNFVRTLKSRDDRTSMVVRKVNKMDQYKKCIEAGIKKVSHKNAYREAFNNVINNIKNVDELLNVHNYLDDSDILGPEESEIIKQKVLQSYPSEKRKFTKIVGMNIE